VQGEDKLGCLGILLKALGIGPAEAVAESKPPYALNHSLLSAAENSFFQTLKLAVPEGCCVMAKVRIADILRVTTKEKWQSHFNRISAKHVDFLVCNGPDMRPLVAIELNDKSHERESRKKRDDFVRNALSQGGLPLIEVPVARAYTVEELRSALVQCLGGK
jgi:hypothetical protein